MNKNDCRENLRFLPSVDALLKTKTAAQILPQAGQKRLTALARGVVDALREELLSAASDDRNYSREALLEIVEARLESDWRDEEKSGLRRVINATGVIVHTNLGRAPLSENAKRALIETVSGYCNLEFDLRTGKRGRRGARAETLLAEITGAESALIVNNCAAAAFLILTVLARGGETIVSRGELVEIGGDFRIPDVLEQSGSILREVGTTNRTKISDYEKAINENTRLLLKVHPSNYRIVGFTEMPDLPELAELARRKNVLLYEDAGSGAIFDLREFGLTDEPIITDSIKNGADVVSFSGDKLLGGAQAGLIVGRGEIIERIRRHPLYRALRVDKLIYAALEATLDAFRREIAFAEIPVLRMLALSKEEIKTRSTNFAEKLRERCGANADLQIEVVEGNSVIGGGSAPLVQPPTFLLALAHRKISAAKMEEILRLSAVPIIARILEDKILMDLRTVSETEESEILEILEKI